MAALKRLSAPVLVLLSVAVAPFAADAQVFLLKPYGVNVTTDVVYDGVNGLTLDVYEPTGGPGVPALKPGFVMAHGGAWIAGNKDDSTFENPAQDGDFNTPMQEYAREFAKRGYVVVNINYRQFDDPGFGSYVPNGLLAAANMTPITNGLNALFSPSSVSEATVRKELELAVEDTVTAINWLITNAGTYGVDTTRIAVGGYSAGAFNSLFAAHVANAPVAAVWSNSGSLGGGGNEALYLDSGDTVPTIAFHGTNDTVLSYAPFGNPLRLELIAEAIPHEFYAMTGEDHYYLRTGIVANAPSRSVPDTQENLLSEFMYDQMDLQNLVVPSLPASKPWAAALLAAGLMLAGGFLVRTRPRGQRR